MSKQKAVPSKKAIPSAGKIKVEKSSNLFSKRFYSLFIFMISFLVYANSIQNDYNLDDELVTQNHRLTSKGIGAIPEIFTEPYYKDNMGYSYEYRPIVLVSFAIEHELFGDNPHVSHFFNVLFYALLCVLFFKVMNKLLGTQYFMVTFLASVLFALHPVHTEIVAGIKSRDEILSLAGALFALYFGLKFSELKKPFHLILTLIFFSLALMSKRTVTSFVLFIPLSIILFRSISFKQVSLITSFLLLPLFFLSSINLLRDRIEFTIAVFMITIFFHFLKIGVGDFADLYRYIIGFISVLKNNSLETKSKIECKSFQQWQSILISGLILVLAGFNVFHFYAGNRFLFNLTFVAPFFLLLLLNWEWKVVVTFFLLSGLLFYHHYFELNDHLILALLVFPFALFGFRSKGGQQILFLLFAICLTVLGSVKQFDMIVVLVGLYLIAFVVRPLAKFRIYFVVGIAVIKTVQFYLLDFKSIYTFDYIFVLGLIAFLSESRESLKTLPMVLTTFFFAFIIGFYVSQHSLKIQLKHRQVKDVSLVAKVVAANGPSIIKSTNRPLNFVEIPVGDKSPLPIKLGTSMDIFAKYLRLILMPYPLSYYYGYKYIDAVSFFGAYPIFVFFMHVLLSFIALFFYRTKPFISFCILIYLISVASVSPVFSSLPGMMADRYLLIPSIGFCLLVTYMLFYFFKIPFSIRNISELPPSLKIIFSVIALLYAGLTFARNKDWKDRVTLFSADIKNVDNSAQAHNLLAVHLGIKSNSATNQQEQIKIREESVNEYKKALAIYPDFMNPSFDLGRTLVLLGRYDEGIEAFKNTIRIKPTFSEPYSNIAVILDAQGKVAEAIPYYQKSIDYYPNKLMVYANLSYAYFKLNDFEGSLRVSRNAIAHFPTAYQPYVNMAKVFNKIGQRDSALVYFEKAYQFNQNDYNLVNTLFSMYAERKDPKALFYANRMRYLPKPKTNQFAPGAKPQ